MENEELYGSSLPLLDKLKLFADWAPLLGRMQEISAAKTPYDQAVAIVNAFEWAAGKSDTKLDDEAIFHIEAVLKTPECKAFAEWLASKVNLA